MENKPVEAAMIRFESFKTLSFMIQPLDYDLINDVNFLNNISINLIGRDELRPKEKYVKIYLQVVFENALEGVASPFISLSCESGFHVENFEEIFVKNSDDSYAEKLNTHLLGTVYATARGVLIEKLATSNSARFILPMLPPNAIRLPKTYKRETKE